MVALSRWLLGALVYGRIILVRSLTLDLLGARLMTEGVMSYGQEFCVAAGGPCANLVTAALLMPLWIRAGAPAGGGLYRLILSSLGFALVNLLPVASMDGGRMLYCLACVCARRASVRSTISSTSPTTSCWSTASPCTPLTTAM